MTFSKVRIQKRKDSRMKTYRPGVNVWAMFMIFLLVLSERKRIQVLHDQGELCRRSL